jgi:integrase
MFFIHELGQSGRLQNMTTTTATTTELQQYFPNNQLQRLADDLTEIHTWDDFARRFLLGDGHSARTTETYLLGCKQFYTFCGALHPMQAGTPEWIESWYDSLSALDLNTRVLRIRSLKFMYRKICERFPFYASPFDTMTETLSRKLNRSKRDESERDALTEREYKTMLKYLCSDKSVKGLQDYAIMRFGVTSGMRAAELVALKWENIQTTEAGYSATFVGKGSKVRTIQLEVEAVKAIRRAHRARWLRMPQPAERVFCSLQHATTTKSTIHNRVKAMAAAGKAAGILRQNLLVSTHVMRHTCATRLVAAGIDIHSVSKHLGHASIATTEIYLHTHADLSAAFASMSA